MKIFKYNKSNSKWYKKIDWVKLLFIFSFSFFLSFLFFYSISNQSNTEKSLFTSIIISLLISLNYFLNDLIENRDRVFILDGHCFGYVEIHKELSGGKFLKTNDFYNIINKEEIEDIFFKNYLYEGIDKGEIESVKYLKKKSNCIILKANVKEKRWKSTSRFVVSKIYLIEKKYEKKIIIPNDFGEYNKIYNILKERNEENV